MTKRLFDAFSAGAGILILSPLLLVLVILVWAGSPGPILFRQSRVGKDGHPFTLLKFRSMYVATEPLRGALAADSADRVTPIGRWLRKFKLDELPQLINVLRGDMSLVGPRPELEVFVADYPESMRRRILSVRPGLTDPAAIVYSDEETILASVDDATDYYRNHLLPEKLKLSAAYVERQNLLTDIGIIFRTIHRIIWPRRRTGESESRPQ